MRDIKACSKFVFILFSVRISHRIGTIRFNSINYSSGLHPVNIYFKKTELGTILKSFTRRSETVISEKKKIEIIHMTFLKPV